MSYQPKCRIYFDLIVYVRRLWSSNGPLITLKSCMTDLTDFFATDYYIILINRPVQFSFFLNNNCHNWSCFWYLLIWWIEEIVRFQRKFPLHSCEYIPPTIENKVYLSVSLQFKKRTHYYQLFILQLKVLNWIYSSWSLMWKPIVDVLF